MRKICIFLSIVGLFAVATAPLHAAIQIRKAETVMSGPNTSSSGTDAASLVPTALGLVSNVMALNQQQNALSAECAPSSSEVNFVNNMMKEWAKVGQMTADGAMRILGVEACRDPNGYSANEQVRAGTKGVPACVNFFGNSSDAGAIWQGYPKVGTADICKSPPCNRPAERQTVTDMYEIFDLIAFGPTDFLPAEATMAARILEKAERCAPAKISAKKRELWGEFLVGTASNLGQRQNTENIMNSVGQMVQGGGMSSLAGIAMQFAQ